MGIGPISLLGKGILVCFRLFSKYWWILLTLVIILSGLVGSVQEAKQEQDWRIPFKFLGGTLISADAGIYDTVQDLEFESQNKEDIKEKASYYLGFAWFMIKNLWIHIWMLLFWFLLFFKLERFLMGNDSKSLRAFLIAFLTMVGLQIIMTGVPFKGIISLGRFIIGVVSSAG